MISEYLDNIKGLIIDMDGVLWKDSEPLGSLSKVFEKIRDLGLNFILATNNASRTVEEYQQKLNRFGVQLEGWQIINSAQAVGIYLSDHYPCGSKVYVVGQPSLKTTIASYGFKIVNEDDEDIRAVVASMDFELSYEKLKHAALLIRSGCEFIGTNPDATYPTPEGLLPGSGTVIGALEIASGKEAKIIGKPQPLLYQMALNRLELAPDETLAIGDRLETDIAGAKEAGMHTALVLTGVSTRKQAERFTPPPDIIAQDLTTLIF